MEEEKNASVEEIILKFEIKKDFIKLLNKDIYIYLNILLSVSLKNIYSTCLKKIFSILKVSKYVTLFY